MNIGKQLYEGKAKKVFATDDEKVVLVDYKDDATAFNGLKNLLPAEQFNNISSTQLHDAFVANADGISAQLGLMQQKDPSVEVLSAETISGIDVDKVLLTIRLLMGISICVLISVALFASFQYKVTTKKLTRVKYYLDHMHNGTLDQLTEEEKAEMEKLCKELVY